MTYDQSLVQQLARTEKDLAELRRQIEAGRLAKMKKPGERFAWAKVAKCVETLNRECTVILGVRR